MLHKSVCSRPFALEWDNCKKYNLKNLTELKEYQLKVRDLEERQILEGIPSSTETKPIPKKKASHPSKYSSRKRGKSVDTQQSDVQKDTQTDDGSDVAKKVLRQTLAQSDVTVLSTTGYP